MKSQSSDFTGSSSTPSDWAPSTTTSAPARCAASAMRAAGSSCPVRLLGCVSSTSFVRGPIAVSYNSASASSDGAGTGSATIRRTIPSRSRRCSSASSIAW